MRPTIVCLCGSTKFKKAYEEANLEETIKGNIVLSVGGYMHADKLELMPEQKAKLDELHLKKIEMADEILVLNVGGYIGKSTARELYYAASIGKKIRFLETHPSFLNCKCSIESEKDCKGCKYHSRCAGVVYGVLGVDAPKVVDGNVDKPWCRDWQELEKNKYEE